MKDMKLVNSLEKIMHRKAYYVSRRYPKLSYEDLMQEAMLLTLRLANGKCNMPKYIVRAIHNRFANLMRNTRRYNKRNIPLSPVISKNAIGDNVYEEIDNKIDRERFIKKLGNTRSRNILCDLEQGLTIKDIAKKNALSVRSVYREIRQLAILRMEWEGSDEQN